MPVQLEFPSRILVVEDDRTIRMMLKKTFEAHCEVLEAEDGATALELMRDRAPDFVITDLMIPEVSGVELIERARRSYWGTLVPIMVLTANTREGVLLDCFRRGADDFMVKPFSIQELRIRVSSIYLRQRAARDRSPLTGLPGNTAIRREVERRLSEEQRFCFATLDIDHFKAFNDTRGFDAGDEVIVLVANLLNEFATKQGDDDIFVGHIGGDDFVALVADHQVNTLATFVHTQFAAATCEYYAQDELETGSVDIVNRHGDNETVPLLSLSIGVVPSDRPGLHDYRRLAEVATEIKKVAKGTPGNSLFVDRRSDYSRS